jgi:hypothetical protein
VSILYRARFTTRSLTLDSIDSLVSSWLEQRGVPLAVPNSGRVEHDGFELRAAALSDPEFTARQLSLREPLDGGRAVTSITLLSQEDVQDCWIDIDWSASDPSVGQPTLQPPDFIARLLAEHDCRLGSARLETSPQLVDVVDADSLANALFDPDRQVPIIVATEDRYGSIESSMERAAKLLDRLLGQANVVVASTDTADAISRKLGRLEISGGAVRLFLPGVELEGDHVQHHVRLPGALYTRDLRAVATRLQRSTNQYLIGRPLPDEYTNRLIYADGFPRSRGSGDAHQLLNDLIAVEQEKDRATAQVEQLEFEIELSGLQLEEAEKQIDSAQARVRFLEGRLRHLGDHESANKITPPSTIPESAETCVEAIGLARQYLPLVEIGSTDSKTSALDTFPKFGAWAKKAWRIFRAMQDYADMKDEEGFDGDFLAYCDQQPHGRTIVPATWVAMKESETTDTNPRYRSARTFPVSEEVDVEGEVYMAAHIKLEAGGRPAPRIHFHDDTSGPSGAMWVGYFGVHLPDSGTN